MRNVAAQNMCTSLWITCGKLWVVCRQLPTRMTAHLASLCNSSLEHTSYASVEHISVHRLVGKITSVISDLYTQSTGLNITPTSS